MKKRLLSLVLALTLSLSLAVPALAVYETPTFPDVPKSFWGYESIEQAAEKGWIAGNPDGSFAPDSNVTYAQFCVMLVNACFPEQLASYTGPTSPWYVPAGTVAAQNGLLTGSAVERTPALEGAAGRSIDRYEMAQMLYNTLTAAGFEQKTGLPAAGSGTPDQASIPDKYQHAVAAVKAAGLITGVDTAGSFHGSGGMTRAQAAVVLCKTAEVLQAGPPKPVPPIEDPSNFSAEYRSSPYYQALQDITLTGDYRTDIIAIAASQLGYYEGDREEQLDGSYRGNGNYSEYGRFIGSPGTAWCSEFASWCARMANVPTDILNSSYGASVEVFGAPYYSWDQTVFAGGDYMPKPGDLALWAWTGKSHTDKYLSHTAIVYSIQEEDGSVLLTTIDGNFNGSVLKRNIVLDAADGSTSKGHLVYFIAPNYD